MPDKVKPPSKIGGGKYEVDKKLGAGCFGEVWRGHDSSTKEQVAIKFEFTSTHSHALQLEHEVEILNLLAKPTAVQGFARCLHWGEEGKFRCMVMDLLGKSLEDRLQSRTGGTFTVASTVLVADQVLRRIEYLHSKGIIHRDIKPENFMFGCKDKVHHLYLIDFGLSKKYYDNKHSVMRVKLSLTGTARYASINAHKGYEQSRRDDLEAIGHMLIYFVRGSLPWSGLEATTQEEKYRKIRETKESIPVAKLCEGYPDAFQTYLRTCRDMDFKERPKYDALRKLFREVRDAEGPLEDHSFEWLKDTDTSTLVPLTPGLQVRQPDETAPSTKCSFCGLCGGSSGVKD